MGVPERPQTKEIQDRTDDTVNKDHVHHRPRERETAPPMLVSLHMVFYYMHNCEIITTGVMGVLIMVSSIQIYSLGTASRALWLTRKNKTKCSSLDYADRLQTS